MKGCRRRVLCRDCSQWVSKKAVKHGVCQLCRLKKGVSNER